jgi:hypothetical protein
MTSEVIASRTKGLYLSLMTPRRDHTPPPRFDADFGVLLRRWRATRRLSQLELALDADG